MSSAAATTASDADNKPNTPFGSQTNLETDETAIKIILLGDSAVGKSKLVERFLMNDYQPRQLSTYALTLFRHETTVNNVPHKVDFWDTAGQERFNSMHPAYYHLAHACIICFDVTRKATYKNLPAWYKELREYRAGIPVICVANKIDVDLAVTSKEFAFPKKHGMDLYYCSASDGTNVVSAFERAIELGVEYASSPPTEYVDEVLSLLEDSASLRLGASS